VKRCKKCGEVKRLSDFYRANGTRDGLRGQCKTCERARHQSWYRSNQARAIATAKRWQQANAERVAANNRRYRAANAQRFRDGHRRRVFNLTAEQYEAVLEAQGGGCALCGRGPHPGRSLHVDHDHETGAIRGLLCFRCNVGIGHFREDKLRMADAIVYLARGRHALDNDRDERGLFVELVCELVGAKRGDVDSSSTIGGARLPAMGAEQTPE
jgi:hypothetical protein